MCGILKVAIKNNRTENMTSIYNIYTSYRAPLTSSTAKTHTEVNEHGDSPSLAQRGRKVYAY